MATLSARVTALAGAVRDKINTMTPRLLPSGGSSGHALVKTSGTDFQSGWAKVNRAFGLSSYCSGKPSASEVVGGGVAPYAFTITAGNCRAHALVAANANAVFTIKRNGTDIGTITFAAAATLASIAISSGAIAIGDNVTITAPATPDSALADISFLLVE